MPKFFDTVSRPDAALSFGAVTPDAASKASPNVIDINKNDVNGNKLVLHGKALSAAVSVKLQQSDDNSSFSDVAGVATGTITGNGYVECYIQGVTKRYLKAVYAGASGTTGTAEAEIYTGV